MDTDIGSDIDDAVCLAYLLKQPKCDLLGITTVTGEPEKRAMIASAMCKVAGKENIPIYPGISKPLLTEQKQTIAPHARALHNWPHETSFPNGEAIEFLRRTIRQHPNEITLLAIGPMTNIALLFSVDPEIPSLLKQLVLMCGVFTYKLPHQMILTEWNALCDPYATSIVYNAPEVKIRSIGLDVTTQVVMNQKEVTEKFSANIMKPLLDFAGIWFKEAGQIMFHDPLAATTIFDENICCFETGDMRVETESSVLAGLTQWSASETGRNEVAVSVDVKAFFDHYFSIVNL